MGFVGGRAIKRDTNIRRPVIVFQPLPMYNVHLLVNYSIVQVESARHSFGHQRLQNSLILAMTVLVMVLISSILRVWWARQMSSA